MKVDIGHKKILISDVAPDGGLGTNWRKIDGSVREGTSKLEGSDPSTTSYKNVNGEVLEA